MWFKIISMISGGSVTEVFGFGELDSLGKYLLNLQSKRESGPRRTHRGHGVFWSPTNMRRPDRRRLTQFGTESLRASFSLRGRVGAGMLCFLHSEGCDSLSRTCMVRRDFAAETRRIIQTPRWQNMRDFQLVFRAGIWTV